MGVLNVTVSAVLLASGWQPMGGSTRRRDGRA
jgi:hypothetical protein